MHPNVGPGVGPGAGPGIGSKVVPGSGSRVVHGLDLSLGLLILYIIQTDSRSLLPLLLQFLFSPLLAKKPYQPAIQETTKVIHTK